MDFLVKIDAGLSLSDTENRCEVEQDAGFQLDNIKFGTVIEDGQVFQVNKAEFNEKLVGRLKNLSFVEVSANDKPNDVREKGENEGWTFICDTQIYVQNHITRVMVFGKKA